MASPCSTIGLKCQCVYKPLAQFHFKATVAFHCTRNVSRKASPPILDDLERVKAKHQRGQLKAARIGYRRLLRKHPKLTPALHYLGVLEHMDGNHDAGLKLVTQAHEREPADYDIRKNLSNILNDMNRAEEAEPIYRVLIKERPEDFGNYSNHSAALRKLGRFDEAVKAARKATELAPMSAMAWHTLGNALACLKDFEGAVAAYEKVIAMEPGFSPAHNSLCQATLQLDQASWLARRRLSRTRTAYQRWVQAVPNHPTARFMLDALEQGRTPDRMPDGAVKASFDDYAGHFDRHIRSLDYRAPELIAEVLSRRLTEPRGQLEVLDGGCGTGLSGHALRPHASRLIGVDLSTSMLDRARATGLYDNLHEAELGTFLDEHPESFDLATYVDVLNYFGDLNKVLARAARALRPGGLLAFTVEKSSQSGSQLRPTGRYSHHPDHVEGALKAADLVAIEIDEGTLRLEANAPVQGLIVSAQKLHADR